MRTGSFGTFVGVLSLLLVTPTASAAQRSPGDVSVTRPDRWFVSSFVDSGSEEPTTRMLYLARDGTVLIVQCAARDGRRTGGWSVMVRREEWSFPTEFVEGYWTVDSEPERGPLRWGGSGPLLMLNENELKDRLLQPVDDRLHLRVTRGDREWSLEFGVRDLDTAVERFAPACQTT